MQMRLSPTELLTKKLKRHVLNFRKNIKDLQMNCFGCHNPKKLGEKSFGFIEFGINEKPSDSENPSESDQLEQFSRCYNSNLTFGWFQGDSQGLGQSYGVGFNDDHPNLPKPHIAPLQTEFYFCSLKCMRSWLMRVMDFLEQQVAGEADPYLQSDNLEL